MNPSFFHTEYLVPGLILLLAVAVVALIAIVQYAMKTREDRKRRK